MGDGPGELEGGPAPAPLTARAGFGPLLQRDYWAVVANARLRPSQLMAVVAAHFPDFAPEELVRFATPEQEQRPLRLGDELSVQIRGAGACAVRVIHLDAQSLTLATLPGHPEAGRITFGAYRNGRGELIFHIRSRARSSGRGLYVGFAVLGEAMQTNTWADFVNRVALTAGKGVRGDIQVETQRLPRDPDEDVLHEPTFWARGD